MFGNPSVATWGTPQWGTVIPKPARLFRVDSVAKALDVERAFGVDVLNALLGVLRSVAVDSVALGTSDRGFAVDFAAEALPPSVWNSLDVAPYLLVEIQLPGGTVRVSERCRVARGAAWDGRLKSAGQILRTVGRGTDDLALVLDDTDTFGQARYRDLFRANDPEGSVVLVWLGAEGVTDAQHLLVFQGRVEQITGFSYAEVTLSALRREAVEDQLLGQLVEEASFPNAPRESLGRMLPVVFGSVESAEGVVTDTNALGTTALNVYASDVVIPLSDASDFPASGRVAINGELIDYASVVGNQLEGLTRGAGGTQALDHPAGSEVAEQGDFVVRFAGHPLSGLSRFKLLLPNGNLGDPVPQPYAVNAVNATATWDGLPQIRDPEASSVYQRVHFNRASPANTATDPQFSARAAPAYEAFQVSRVLPGQNLSLLTNAEGLGEPGDIEAVWLGVIFDPDSIGQGFSWAFADVGGAGGARFALAPTDLVPDEVARRDERTGDRVYDVPAPTVDQTTPSPQPYSLTPSVVLHPGIWGFQANAARVVDKDVDTEASYMFIGIGEAAIVGSADAVFKVEEGQTLPGGANGGTVTSAKIVFVAGWEKTPFTSSFEVWLEDDSGEIDGTRFQACSSNPPVACVGLIRGKERFEHEIDPAIVAGITGIRWVVSPQLGVSNGLWVGAELWIEGELTPPQPQISVVQDTRASVTNYFEVTNLLPRAQRAGGPVLDWDWFGDAATGGRLDMSVFFTPDPQGLKVIEVFYVVKFRPFVQANSQQPRVFADVVGQVPTGDPVEIARALVTTAPPLGLGLDASRVDAASYTAAQASLAADAVRADFAVYRQRSVLDLLSQLAAETDCRETWDDAARHRITRRPRADTALPVVATLGDCDVLDSARMKLSRSPIGDVVNRAELRWRVYAPTGEPSAAAQIDNAASQANPNFGVKPLALDLTLIADAATAALVAARKLERQGVPRWIVELDAPPSQLNLERGDLVSLSARDFSCAVGEVTQINFTPRGFRRASLQIAVWDL